MKQNRVAGGTYLNYERHDFWLPLVRDRRLRAATTADLQIIRLSGFPKCGCATDKKTVKKLIIFFTDLKTV
jgi:hypothetical protein